MIAYDGRTIEEKLKNLALRYAEADQTLAEVKKRYDQVEREWRNAIEVKSRIATELTATIGANIPERHILVDVKGEGQKLVIVDRNGVWLKELVK